MKKSTCRKFQAMPILAASLALAVPSNVNAVIWSEEPVFQKAKPEFSEEELTKIRSLPKKERKAFVKALKLKYSKG
jgi:hypothetical protein